MKAVALSRRSRLYRLFKPRIDGLKDQAKARVDAIPEPQQPLFGQWQKSRPMSYELEVIERIEGKPATVLARAFDAVHRREIVSLALVALDCDGVIHSAWSDGDLETMGRSARFLSDDLLKAHGAS